MELFEQSGSSKRPLAERVRPETLDDFVGQEHLLGVNKPLRKMLEGGTLSSFLIYGPPGSGKTTIAFLAAKDRKKVVISATTEHIKDVKKIIEVFVKEKNFSDVTPVVIVDEIQHFNKKEQDAFLEPVEKGDIILIGLTTENPSFYIISPLLSRLSIFVFEKLTVPHIEKIVDNATKKDKPLSNYLITPGARKLIAEAGDGDARKALNLVEAIFDSTGKKIIEESDLKSFTGSATLLYGEELHYDLISAFIKSMRGSDPDAALYYMYRMIEAGEDPLYIARRMIRFAAEDVGLKDPNALVVANAAQQAFHFVGPPEGYLALAEAAVYLAKAPKSNTLYIAESEVKKTIEETGSLEVPKKLRNPVTKLMKNWGYGQNYKYPHDFEGHIVKGEKYLPDEIKDKKFYREE